MDKPALTPSAADPAPEVPPPATPVAKAAPSTEVAAPTPAPAPVKAKSEKALRLAKALRDNLKRRKVSIRPARPSN